jgi:hypothetical protein
LPWRRRIALFTLFLAANRARPGSGCRAMNLCCQYAVFALRAAYSVPVGFAADSGRPHAWYFPHVYCPAAKAL